MTTKLITAMIAVLFICTGVLAEDYDFYKYLRYPRELVPGVGRDKIEQEGGEDAVGYQRRTVKWWPRKGQDIVDVPEGAPLHVWTRNNGQKDPAALAGLDNAWAAGDEQQFEAHLVQLRSIGTSTTDSSDPGDAFVPLAVLRMPDGRQRAVLNFAATQMVSMKDYDFVREVWEDAYPKLYAKVSQDTYVARKKSAPGGGNSDLPLSLWKEGRPKFNAIESPKDYAEFPVWGEDKDKIVFETKHYHIVCRKEVYGRSGKWIRPDNIEQQNIYRKCVMEFAENFWTYMEAAGASMPYWRLEGPNYKYVVLVQGPGYGGGGGWMHCGVGDCRPAVLGHELFHSMPNGGWSGYFFESMCDSGMHTSAPGHLHTFSGNFTYPWRNVNRVQYKSSLWCFVLGDNPNWGYGIQMVLGSLAGVGEPTPYHTIARLGQQRGLWKNGVRGFGDFFGEYAARMATCDFVEQLPVRNKFGTPPLSYVYPVYGQENRYRISGGQAPRWCGYNIARLEPAEGAEEITVDFQGIEDPDKHSDWRACIVAVDESGKPRYSPLWNKGEMTFAIEPSDIRVWLTVAATPSAFAAPEADQMSNGWVPGFVTGTHAARYPWEVTLRGCKPGLPHRRQGDVGNFDELYAGIPTKQEIPIPLGTDEGEYAQEKLSQMLPRIEAATEALDEEQDPDSPFARRVGAGQKKAILKDLAIRAKFLQKAAEGHRHPNGGGFVSDDAQVAETAYVGPDAMVLRGARVEGNACVKGAAVVIGPKTVITGNAKVGGMAWVFGNIEVGGNARILEAATVSNTRNTRQTPGGAQVKIAGNAVIKGDAEVSISGSDTTIAGGLVVDYTPRLDVNESGVFTVGRFCSLPGRRQKITLKSGKDAGALYANWQFDNPSVAMLVDSYVNNVGLLHGRPEFAEDDGRKCIVLNGEDQYAEAPASVADFSELTIDMSIKRPANGGGRLFDFGTSDEESFFLVIDPDSGEPTLVARHDGRTLSVTASEPVPADKWCQVRVEMDGSTASIYIDGQQVTKKEFAFSPREVFIGDLPEGNFIACGRDKDEFFGGRIDHFRVYRAVHDEFESLGPVPAPLVEMDVLAHEEKPNNRGGNKEDKPPVKLKYFSTADWEHRTPEEIKGEVPGKMKDWLMRVRGY